MGRQSPDTLRKANLNDKSKLCGLQKEGRLLLGYLRYEDYGNVLTHFLVDFFIVHCGVFS